jgi:hypothetical protein
MPLTAEASPLALHHPDSARRLREVLGRAGYNEGPLAQLLGARDLPSLLVSRPSLLQLRHLAQGDGPLETLARLFLAGAPVGAEAARRAIRPTGLEDWVEAGLVRAAGGEVCPAVRLLPCQGLVLACDLPPAAEGGRDRVLGLGGPPLLLAQLTVRRHSRRTLDLCTGGGIHALLATAHSDQVVGVDVNPRAVNFATFNARLNGMANVCFLEGDLFEPVRGQPFDLVVANPPYVISPEARYLFRDSGLPGDQLCRDIVRAVPGFLQEGGYAQVLCNWAQTAGQDWRERLDGWVAGTGCDAWVLRLSTHEPASYAEGWLRGEAGLGPEEFARRFEGWMAYYDRERIEAIGFGLVTLRRASGRANWFRCEDAPPLRAACGEAIVRGFALRDFLENARDDGALLDSRLRPATELRWEQEWQADDPGWQPATCRLRLAAGLAYARTANGPVVDLIGNCRGRQPLRHVVSELAQTQGLSLEAAAPAYLPLVRRLVEQGFFLPDGVGSAP